MITAPSIQGQLNDLALNNVFDTVGAGAPTSGSSGTGAGYLGPGSFYYDSTNQILYVQTGTLATPVWAPWSLNDPTSTGSGTTQNTEYTLNSVTIPATFLKGVRGLIVEAWGTLAANANAKNVKLYFGGTAIVTVTGSTANAKDYWAQGTILRTGASTQTSVAGVQIDTGQAFTMAVNGAVAETDTANIVIALKTANTAAAAASGTGKGMAVSLLF
jgi:hypothetical protein